MQNLATLIFLSLITFSSCQKDNGTNANLPAIPYVNLKYPALGQISKYQFYQKYEPDFCVPNYTGDTMILEIFEETANGFLMREYLSDFSFSKLDSTGLLFTGRDDVLIKELEVKNDTAFFTRIEGGRGNIFLVNKMPLITKDTLVTEVLECTPPLQTQLSIFSSGLVALTLHDFKMNNQIFHNVIVAGNLEPLIEGSITFEVIQSSYHQVIQSSTIYNDFLVGYWWNGLELILVD